MAIEFQLRLSALYHVFVGVHVVHLGVGGAENRSKGSKQQPAYFALPLGQAFQPLPWPFCFHSWIKAGMFSIACRLISRRPLSVRSQSFPLTFCPSPVPLTCSPLSTLLRSFSPGFLMVQGSRSTTPCWEASLTKSACFRRP